MNRESEENNHKSSESPKSHLMKRSGVIITAGEKSGDFSLPIDMTVEILKKLPVKCLLRFRCVSKQWSTIIGSRRDLLDSIVTRSLNQQQQRRRPHFIFHHWFNHKPFFFFTSTYPHNTEKQKLTPKVSIPSQYAEYQYVRGLISCSTLKLHQVTVYNPTTRQSSALPNIKSPTWPFELTYSLFGYDPVKNHYKVLCLFNGLKDLGQTCLIFTLGDPKRQWRHIEGFQNRYPVIKEVQIDGIIYCGARILRANLSPVHGTSLTDTTDTALMSFNVRTERFDHVKTPEPLSNILLDYAWRRPALVNYGGKLGCICWRSFAAEMWVMENAEKQEWTKISFCLPFPPPYPPLRYFKNLCSGVTSDGEVFLVSDFYSFFDQPLYVYYYDPKRNSLRRVEIEGTGPRKFTGCLSVLTVHDHAENTMWL